MIKRSCFLFAGALVLWLSGCTTAPVSDVPTEPVDVGVPKMLPPAAVVGTWRGVIPCADCPGINYNLSLGADNRFEETLIYQDRDVQPFTRTGTWGVKEGRVELQAAENGATPTLFELTQAGELNMLDQDGKPITTALAPMYLLRRDTALIEDNPSLWNEKRRRGIDFVATGNEPGWSLEIDLEQSMTFRTLPSESISIETPVPDPLQSGNKTVYRATTEEGELQVEIMEQPCEDTMSGKVSPYLVRVNAKGISFKGCGMYLQ
ncbi:copper resistance protein NlpE N-terminal domain-containing protein [Pontibacter litorisediminis]|uniref:copper resistance protein NlpE N-terminal domain-containing protein n=1 Tax=Pontibacter litorisediminis TaxID=1846260 RepID=UPI0023EAA1AD|nr:copper resistance protein NlpE N-terminal domain-containing protein [Pontibacter litorisediminis]